jgi:23S rRNA (adenine-N6)-dimethyltransferase
MKKIKLPVRFTGQHFTIDKVLINDAIGHAEIGKNDYVLDIGAGKGFLTIHLIRKCNNVIAIENDSGLIKKLRQKFYKNPKVKVVNVDFRSFIFPKKSFKVVSNIPFRITSDILRLLMYDNLESFMGGSLIISFESVQKLFSRKVFNPYIIVYNTFYDLKIIYEISPISFMPPPNVKSALLRIKKNERCIATLLKTKYVKFLFFMLQHPDLSARTVLKKLFRKSQLREISGKFRISLDKQITYLSAKQWSQCFIEMLKIVPEKYHPT